MNEHAPQSSPPDTVEDVLVLGGGSAGLLAALTLKTKRPALRVTVVHSPAIGVIGVGEGTTAGFANHLIDYLQVDLPSFYRLAEPTWKLGIRFGWGTRDRFYYSFGTEFGYQPKGLAHPVGFYYDDDSGITDSGPITALMHADRVFVRGKDGRPQMHRQVAFHFENQKLVAWLETACENAGVEFIQSTVADVPVNDQGVAGLTLDDGQTLRADLYIDASGFRSELLGKALGVPFLSFADALACDRAVVGGWDRDDEPIHPYTTSETMHAGWAWRIELEDRINRGYVYGSAFISDDDAEAEFRAANPKLTDTRVVRFRSGRYERLWEKNVVAVGNASGFVEPLEATALQAIAIGVRALVDILNESRGRVTPSLRRTYNQYTSHNWEDIRDFLAVHYRFNERLGTPFWKHCADASDLGHAAEAVALYQENGPILSAFTAAVPRPSQFGAEGYLTLLVGMGVPHAGPKGVSTGEAARWRKTRRQYTQAAARAMTVSDALASIRQHGPPKATA